MRNLIENVVNHAPAGTEMRSSMSAECRISAVAHGAGVPPE